MARFAIKKLPLNLSSMYNKVDNPMSIRAELGEFEVDVDSVEQARELAKLRVSSNEPNMICPWSERTNCFTVGAGRKREFVHPTALYKYDGKRFVEDQGNCHRDQPTSGFFMSKENAKADYLAHKVAADKKIDEAMNHLKAMETLGVSIDYHIEGDTHGIFEDYMYLEVTEGPYQFTVKYGSD
ncbi:hypothetical protein [Alteromonas gracilis]|uniref:hypothetical protein n=1 Tax=Alteromonas gracilis TaxID=1479524 RepID=UPI00373621B0